MGEWGRLSRGRGKRETGAEVADGSALASTVRAARGGGELMTLRRKPLNAEGRKSPHRRGERRENREISGLTGFRAVACPGVLGRRKSARTVRAACLSRQGSRDNQAGLGAGPALDKAPLIELSFRSPLGPEEVIKEGSNQCQRES